MISKTDLIKIAKREFATTIKVMRAFPSDKAEFRPHERSSDTTKLFCTFVFEMYLLASYVFGETVDRTVFKTYRPTKLGTIVADFEKETRHITEELEKISIENLEKTIDFGGRKFTADEFIIMMISDQIHHRGQLSVYIRLAGGKVPAIYGPSADDPGTNL